MYNNRRRPITTPIVHLHRDTMAARRLFKDGSREEVRAVLDSEYGQCIKAMTTPKNTLAALDTFWRKTLPATLKEREGTKEGAYVTKSELYQIMKW